MRHKWDKSRRYAICTECGCRYRQGVVSKQYEHRDGTRTWKAGNCPGKSQDGIDAAEGVS